MTEVAPDQNNQSGNANKLALKDITQIVYICQALSFLFGLTAIAGVIVNYIKRDDVKGTWLESHFRWQIRTFWFSLLWGFLGVLLSIIFIGILVLIADWIWVIYRVVKGWLALAEHKSLYGEAN